MSPLERARKNRSVPSVKYETATASANHFGESGDSGLAPPSEESESWLVEKERIQKILESRSTVERDHLKAILAKYRAGTANKWEKEELTAIGLVAKAVG